MTTIPNHPHDEGDELRLPRIFLREPGWQVGMKIGSDREFCATMFPGEDYYHRLSDGELFIHRSEERLCLPCAERRGLLAHEPKLLRQPIRPIPIEETGESDGYELGPPPV